MPSVHGSAATILQLSLSRISSFLFGERGFAHAERARSCFRRSSGYATDCDLCFAFWKRQKIVSLCLVWSCRNDFVSVTTLWTLLHDNVGPRSTCTDHVVAVTERRLNIRNHSRNRNPFRVSVFAG